MANPRFIDNGDGTVTLPALGLMFSQATITEVDVTQHQAEDLCRELRLAGHADWRLPSDHELLALVDRSRHNPAIDTTFFPDTKPNWYWTSTVCAWSSSRAWCVDFYLGGGCSLDLRAEYGGLVRAVRSVPAGYGYVPVPVELADDAIGVVWGDTAMTDKQPDALALADHLEQFRSFPDDLAAAAELRRLHAELQRLQGEARVMRGLLRQHAEVLYALLHAVQGVIEPKAKGACDGERP